MGVRRFVYCSSSEVYGNTSIGLLNEDATPCRPVTVYGAAKLAGELYAEAYRQTYGLPTVVVRPFNAYGPRAHEQGDLAEVVVRVSHPRPQRLAAGDFRRRVEWPRFHLRHRRGARARLAGESDLLVGQRVNIAFGRMLTVKDVARTIMQVCGRNDLDVQLSRPRPGDVGVLRADTRRASEILGFRARIGFEDGIRRYLDWFRKRHPDPAVLLESNVENWTIPTVRFPDPVMMVAFSRPFFGREEEEAAAGGHSQRLGCGRTKIGGVRATVRAAHGVRARRGGFFLDDRSLSGSEGPGHRPRR